jgi:hypothetical protein
MTIDCTNLKPGDMVRLRNGSIDTVAQNDRSTIPIRLKKENNWYNPDGSYCIGIETEYDIRRHPN